MNWYKQSQSREFPTWYAKELQRLTNNYTKPIPPIIQSDFESFRNSIETWVRETNPDLSSLTLMEAFNKSQIWKNTKHHRTPHDIKSNDINKTLSEHQNFNPSSSDFMIDIREKHKSIPANIKSKINKEIHALGNFHVTIPIETVMNICEKYGVVLLQEDGTKWSGFLIGGKECGSDEAKNQFADFDLAVRTENGQYVPANNIVRLTWCKMNSGKYEIICYLS